MKFLRYIFIFVLVFPNSVFGQSDSNVFSQSEFIWFVKNFHPLSVQSELLLQAGESTVRKARGGFDPLLQSSMDQKYYDGKQYYSILNGGLKVPTWYGIELKTGIDDNRGEFLNPQNTLPDGGLYYAGVSITIGQGLIIDKRRAALKQAKIFSQSTEVEQQRMLNDLYFNAIKNYWNWVEAWNRLKVHEESVELALTRFIAVRESFLLGDIPAIDTLEAFIQLQNRQLNFNQSSLNYQNQSLVLSNFLWTENNTPLEIAENLHPPALSEIELNQVISMQDVRERILQLDTTHPELRLYYFKLARTEVEMQLKKEMLKPKLNLNYNAITEPFGNTTFSSQNYTWGFDFSFPVFLRKERGDLQLAKLKMQNIELDQQQKSLELENKVLSYYNEQRMLQTQVLQYQDAVNNYDKLLQGEKEKFEGGESALFLVNSREINLIQARLKLIELVSKYNISTTGLLWALGTLYSN